MSSLVGMIDASTSPDRMRYGIMFLFLLLFFVVSLSSSLFSRHCCHHRQLIPIFSVHFVLLFLLGYGVYVRWE